jgi:hypothetical protein
MNAPKPEPMEMQYMANRAMKSDNCNTNPEVRTSKVVVSALVHRKASHLRRECRDGN